LADGLYWAPSCPPRLGTVREHIRAGEPDPSAPGRYRHPARRPPAGNPAAGTAASPRWPAPDGTAVLIDQLRAGGTALIYEPVGLTPRAGGHDAPSVTIGRDH